MLHKDTHRQYLYNIIIDLFRSSFAKHIAFKWWTACYFLYGLTRFSTDIDLDLIGHRDRGENIDHDIVQLLKKYGTVKQGHHIVLSYGETHTNIHIEISRKVWKSNTYEIKNFFGTDILVQDRGTIVANKLVALVERAANRDYFDAHYFLTQAFPINEKLIIERTWDTVQKLYSKIISKIDKLPPTYKILDGLWETLYDEKQKSLVKKMLLNDLKWVLQMRMGLN